MPRAPHPSELERVLKREFVEDKGVFDSEQFDIVTYLNNAFPDDDSLNQIDGKLKDIEDEIASIDSEIKQNVRQ